MKYAKNFHPFDSSFKEHCKNGKLPSYVVIEQRFWDLHVVPANDDHPSYDVSEGQNFVKEVYEALRSSPQWEQMLFIITYDEHGGFYDRVPTPVVGVPSPEGIVGNNFNFQFDRLGVRVRPSSPHHGLSLEQVTLIISLLSLCFNFIFLSR